MDSFHRSFWGDFSKGGRELAGGKSQPPRDTGTWELSLPLNCTAREWVEMVSQVEGDSPCRGKEGMWGMGEQNCKTMLGLTVSMPYYEKSLKTDESIHRTSSPWASRLRSSDSESCPASPLPPS